MNNCLICKKATDEANNLCPECGKIWNDSVSRKEAEEYSHMHTIDQYDAVIRDCESGSPSLQLSLNAIVSEVNILVSLNNVMDYISSKSTVTYQFLLTVLQNVLEYYPFQRVMIIKLTENVNIASLVANVSPVLSRMIADYIADIRKELSKSLSKKDTARRLILRQKRLRVELIGLIILSILSGLTALILYISGQSEPLMLLVVALVPFIVLVVMKLTRYSSLNGNLKTNSHLSYQIDLLDIPESYINNLKTQLQKLEAISIV